MIDDEHAPLASPQRRLAAVTLDAALGVVPLVLVVGLARALGSSSTMLYGLLAIGALSLPLGAVNLFLLARHGQSVGKRALGLRILRTDGGRASLARLLFARMAVPALLGAIPFVGPVFGVVDGALVFTEGRKTVHDRIADTIVVDIRDAPPASF